MDLRGKPGCGHSDHDPHRSLRRYAADIAALLDHLELVDGEGHSLGALVRDDLATLVRDATR